MDKLLNLDEISDSIEFVEKEYNLKIVRAELITAATGAEMIQFDFLIEKTTPELFIKFENCVINDKDGKPFNMGRVKLKKIMTATRTTPNGEFPVSIVPKLLQNKRFSAFVTKETKNEKTYLKIGNLNTITFANDGEHFTPEELKRLDEQGIGVVPAINKSDWGD